jgi:hypothetical protein
MKITVTTLTELTFQLEVPDDLELENFKAFCEIESGIPGEKLIILCSISCIQRKLKIIASYEVKFL